MCDNCSRPKPKCSCCPPDNIPMRRPEPQCGCSFFGRPHESKKLIQIERIPSKLGTSAEGQPYAPRRGMYQDRVVYYYADGAVYLYDSDGDYVALNDAANTYTKDQLDEMLGEKSAVAVIGSGAPTSSTIAKNIGQPYYDTVNQAWYLCSAITPQGTTPETYVYSWTKLASIEDVDDLQTEIDSVKEDMTDLTERAELAFPIVADMKLSTTLRDGSLVETYGWYEAGDGGGALYRVREVTNQDVVDESKLIQLADVDLVAELVINDQTIYAKQWGLRCDGITDEATKLQSAIDYCKDNNLSLTLCGFCRTETSINTKGITINGIGKPPITDATYKSKKYGNIGWDYLKNTGNGALITFEDFVNDYLDHGSGICSETANPIIYCNHLDGKFNLNNLAVAGWLRTENQDGIKATYDGVSSGWIDGHHHFKDVNVCNCGGNGIRLTSLENTVVDNLRCNYNFGNGLYVEGDLNYDTPFEYVVLNNCKFIGNKQHGVYAKNSARKSIRFNNCDFSRAGLYSPLARELPSSTDDFYCGVKIDGHNNYVAGPQTNLIIDNCFGEELGVMVNVSVDEPTGIYGGISVINSTIYPIDQRSSNAMIYLNNQNTYDFNFHNNMAHFSSASGATSIKLSSRVAEIVPITVDSNFYKVYNQMPTVTVNPALTVVTSSLHRFGNLVYINYRCTANDNIAAWQNLLSGFPKPLDNTPISITVGNTATYATLYTNNTCTSPTPINNGDTVIITACYPVKFNSPRSGN